MLTMRILLLLFMFLAVGINVALAQRDLKDIPVPDPELEKATFVLPEGFEVNLFAADPQIAKPIQMNFDPEGRLWIASSEVYPQIEPGQEANDKILILQDKDGDGVSDETKVFAGGLLIPTGIEPGDGGAYVGASTELLHFTDKDGDGEADERRVVLSGFGTEDTHHILHTLRWGQEGLLYMSQSIYIHSHVETPWGVKRLNAGGIWQFRPETLQLDVFARGLVNTWGTDFNQWGVTFATDGAGGEGINYMVPGASYVTAYAAPRILQGLNPGSPKHCSLEIVDSTHFPDDWRGSFIANDFRGHRVCRFVLKESGSGFVSQEQQEVIKSDHVAFRPVDVKVGPDGALYIADWYNPIIQHGEVDFRDERRDHTHGRIWRVSYTGGKKPELPKFRQLTCEELVGQLASPDAWIRRQAKRVIKERGMQGERAEMLSALKHWARTMDNTAPGYHQRRLEALWTYQALDEVEPELLDSLLRSTNADARAAASRVVGHWWSRLDNPQQMLELRVQDEHPRVRLEAVRVLTHSTDPHAIELALTALDGLKSDRDVWLDYALWLTARDLQPIWQPALLGGTVNFGGNVTHLVFALKSAGSSETVPLLAKLLAEDKLPAADLGDALEVVSQFGSPEELEKVLGIALSAPPERAIPLLQTLLRAGKSRGVRPAGSLDSFAALLEADQPEIQSLAARCVGAWKFESLLPALDIMAKSEATLPGVRLAVVEALSDFENNDMAVNTLAALVDSSALPEVARQAIMGLVRARPQQGATAAVAWLSRLETPTEAQPLFAVVLARKDGPGLLSEAIRGQMIPKDVAIVGLRAAQSSGQDLKDFIEALRVAGNVSTEPVKLMPEEMLAFVDAVAKQGDPARGEEIYRRSDLACLKCHAIGPAGGQVGPNMLSLGSTAQLDYIVESLLDPAAKVKEGFHTAVVASSDGQVYSGIKLRETDRDLILRDAEDRELKIPLDSIEEQNVGNSLMPAGLTASLTTQEIYDLAAFLSALGKLPEYTVTPVQRVRLWEVLNATPEAAYQLRRVSYAHAASDDPAFTWSRTYSNVRGYFSLEDLPSGFVKKEFGQNRSAAGMRGVGFARFTFEAAGAGVAILKFNDIAGLQIWHNGLPLEAAPEMNVPVSMGPQRFTFAIDAGQRQTPLDVQISEPEGQTLIQLPTGK